jgi:hypothetical protein
MVGTVVIVLACRIIIAKIKLEKIRLVGTGESPHRPSGRSVARCVLPCLAVDGGARAQTRSFQQIPRSPCRTPRAPQKLAALRWARGVGAVLLRLPPRRYPIPTGFQRPLTSAAPDPARCTPTCCCFPALSLYLFYLSY